MKIADEKHFHHSLFHTNMLMWMVHGRKRENRLKLTKTRNQNKNQIKWSVVK